MANELDDVEDIAVVVSFFSTLTQGLYGFKMRITLRKINNSDRAKFYISGINEEHCMCRSQKHINQRKVFTCPAQNFLIKTYKA